MGGMRPEVVDGVLRLILLAARHMPGEIDRLDRSILGGGIMGTACIDSKRK